MLFYFYNINKKMANPETPELKKLKAEYEDIKKKLDLLKSDTNKDQKEREKEANQLIQSAQEKEKELKTEIDKIKNKQNADQQEIEAANQAEDFLKTVTKEVQDLHDNIVKPSSTSAQTPSSSPTQTPTQTSSDDNFFTKAWKWIWTKLSDAWSWIWKQWNNIRDKNKWKDETWNNIARTLWFAATWIWVLWFVYRWIKSLFWWWKSSKESDWKDEEKEEKESLLENAAGRLFKHLSDAEKKSK